MRACHDLSEGGLAVALAEMAFAGGIGADVTDAARRRLPDEVRLFSESTTRFLIEVKPEHAAAFEACFAGLPLAQVGVTVDGAAAADRRGQRRVAHLGEADGVEGSVAESRCGGERYNAKLTGVAA